MAESRRGFIKLGVAALAAFTTLRSWAAWPKAAFEAKTTKETLEALHGSGAIEANGALRLLAPEIAENGTVVPITIQSDLKDIESLTLIAEENPRPLVATYALGKYSALPISTRIKMSKTQNIVVIAKAQGKLYSATKQIKVTVGGCGG
jgi:sulfur-oxidizing protein SoxY